ncbi:unnamed protein product, partial [Ilex paraguariensis]
MVVHMERVIQIVLQKGNMKRKKETHEQVHDSGENTPWQEDDTLLDDNDAILDISYGNANEGQPLQSLLEVVVYESKQMHGEGLYDINASNKDKKSNFDKEEIIKDRDEALKVAGDLKKKDIDYKQKSKELSMENDTKNDY